MRRFKRDLEPGRNRRSGIPRKLRRADEIYDLIRGAHYFIGELAGQKNRRLRNAEIRRPFFGFVYATQKRCVLVRRKVSVKSRSQCGVHDAKSATTGRRFAAG